MCHPTPLKPCARLSPAAYRLLEDRATYRYVFKIVMRLRKAVLRHAKQNFTLVTGATPQLDASLRQLPKTAFAMEYCSVGPVCQTAPCLWDDQSVLRAVF